MTVRTQVTATTTYPYSTVVQVEATYADGSRFVGSGVVVGVNDVLTAAHVVYGGSKGAATSISVQPALNNGVAPFGKIAAFQWDYYRVDQNGDGLLTATDTQSDVALLSFDRDFTTGWMGTSNAPSSGTASISGYPATTLNGRNMFTETDGWSTNADGNLNISRFSVEGGNSGGPVWIDQDPGPGVLPYVIGIVSTASSAFSLSSSAMQYIYERMAQNDLLRPDPLIDRGFYNTTYRDIAAAGASPKEHYYKFGWQEGRDPNPYFDSSGYLAVNRDVAAAGLNPLEHYRNFGWREGRDPSESFDVSYYLRINPDVRAAQVDPLTHWLSSGIAEGRKGVGKAIGNDIAGGLDVQYYLMTNPDVAAARVDARQHYQTFGWREGRDPNLIFDADGYLAAFGDVRAAGIDPLAHYLANGWREGRDPSLAFDTSSYLNAYRDVAAAGINPMMHYLQFGRDEGRSAFSDGLWT